MINRDNYHYLYRLSKKTIPFLKKKNRFTFVLNRKEKNDTTNSLLTKKILENKPYMVARYGSTESRAILNFLLQKNKISEVSAIIKHITGKMNIYWKNHPKFLNNLVELSGFFPKEEKQLEEFVN